MQKRLIARARAVNIWLMTPLLGLALFVGVFASVAAPVQAATTSSTLNFQARLLNNLGGIVPDGNYNIDFKIYNADSTTGTVGTCTGACVWEETRTGANTVKVVNGYFSVNLGSVTAFSSSINWDQQLWLTMNIGGTGGTPSWDGEMQNGGHSISLTALPYSFTAGQLAKTSGANRGVLGFNTVANNPVITLPDETGTVCTTAATGICTQAGTGFVQLQNATPGTAQTGSFNINGTGIATTLQASTMDTATAVALGIGTTHATEIDLNQNTVIAAGKALTITGSGTRPASPTKGMLYFDTTTNRLIQYNGSRWVSAPRSKTEIVAASTSTQAEKDAADFVATGSDDGATINSAFSALPSGGGSVYLMEGTFTLGATSVNVPDNTTLEGSGNGTVLTYPAAFGTGTTIYYAIKNSDTTTGTNVAVKNLLVDGNKANQSAGNFNGIYFNGMGSSARTGGSITNVTVQNIYGNSIAAITLSSSAQTTVSGNTLTGNGTGGNAYGIYLTASTYNSITGNLANKNEVGIWLESSSSHNTITGNTADSNINYGITLNGTNTYNTIVSNTADGNVTGIYLASSTSSNNTISDNTAVSNTNYGISISGATNTITGNITNSNSFYGINLNPGATKNAITGNISSSNTLYGIRLTGATNNLVSGNKLESNGGNNDDAIYIQNSSTNNSITANDITDTACSSTCFAINISDAGSTGNYLASNHFVGDGTHAASINDATSGGNTYSNQPLTEKGDASFRNATNSTTAFQIQNAAGSSIFNVDTTNGLVGTAATSAASTNSNNLTIQTGNATGTTSNSGNLTLDVGTATGTKGSVSVGTANASSITIGNTSQTGATTILAGSAGVVVKPSASTGAFQVQNATSSKSVMAVDTSGNQLVLGTPGVGGITGQIKLYYAGSAGSITLAMSDPGSSNYTLTIPTGGGTICTTGNSLCTGGGGGTSTGLAKNAVDTSSADALTGYLYAFTNSGNAETGGVLSLDNGNNTGPALFLKDTSAKALQLQNASNFNALVADTSGTSTHLKVYDGTATGAYADIYYNDSSSSAIFVASAGTTQVGGGSLPTLLTAGTGQAVTITGHASSSWTLDSGDLTLDVTGTTPNMNIGTGATAKTINIGNQTGATAVNIKSGTGSINLAPAGTSNTGVVIKTQTASTLALQVQDSSTTKAVMAVDTSGDQLVVGDGSSGGITGKLAFSAAGASGKIVLTPSASPGSSTFTLQLPAENGTICTTAGSAACLAVYGGGVSGTFLAKDATDTSSADSGAGYLYAFTNSGISGSGGVLKLNNGSNTGSTLVATTTANPGSGKAVIYAENKNATPTGNLLDLESGTTPTSVFSVDAAGEATAAGQLSVMGSILNGSSLTFGDTGNPSALQAASGQALNITANATSLWQVGGTNQNLTIQTSGTGILAVDTAGAGTVDLGNANATTIAIGGANGAVTTIGGGDAAHTIHIGDGGSTTVQTISIGSTSGASATTISAGSGNLNLNASAAMFTEITGTRTLGIATRSSNLAGTNFTIQAGAGGSGATAVGGGTLTLSGGNAAGTGNANGGNVNLKGGSGVGTGATGLVVLNTPAFATTTADPNCYTGGAPVSASCTIAQSSVDGSAAVLVGFFNSGQTATLPSPTITTPGKLVYITAASGSQDFTLSVNGGGAGNQIAMRQNTSATMIWSGSAWTAAGASSSTTLQAAYDNTLQSAGGAELVVSKTTATNGLTIRDSITNPVNGTLLSVQTSSAATLLSVNDSVAEYAADGGAETAGASSSVFPASTWTATGAATVSRYTTVGNYVATGQASVSVQTTTAANDGAVNRLSSALTANMHYNVSFTARLASGTFYHMAVYYSVDGTAQSVACATDKTIPTSIWAKVNCAFQAPSAGITSSNAILIEQALSGTARTFYVDNLSVTIAADYNYATDGGVDDNTNFSTNWTAVGGSSVSRSTSAGNDASDSAQVITTGTGQGIRNKLSTNLLTNTLYRVSIYAASTTSGFNTFTVQYSRDGGTNFVSCADYNTQTVSSTVNSFTQVTCYLQTDSTAATSPYVYFTQTDSTGRTFYVDTFSISLTTNTAPNIQIGGGINGGPVALLTLDRAASAPIAANNDALLGSMYYDTTLGKLQCYEADGWGACGSSPDNIVTISPEYTNAVMHGTGVGTMTSDICSSTLHINDGTSGQSTICGTNETFNFYKWTSPQASAQTYSIYVTYQLPGTFKTFSSGQTSIMGRTDSTNATVAYSVYRDSSSTGLTQCGPSVTVSNGSVSAWQTGTATGATDPSTCGFNPGDSIVFKIDVTASQNADAYVGNLNFTFSNK